MAAGGDWLRVVEGAEDNEVRYIALWALTSAHFSDIPVALGATTRRATLVVEGQVIVLDGAAAEAAEAAVQALVGQ